MAYTLTDHFRPLRLVMRFNGLVLGFGAGAVLLFSSKASLLAWGVLAGGSVWPLRATGGLLLAWGLTILLSANQDVIEGPPLFSMITAHALLALVLLTGYLQQEFIGLSGFGRLLLIFVFMLCLIGAVTPLRYLRTVYR